LSSTHPNVLFIDKLLKGAAQAGAPQNATRDAPGNHLAQLGNLLQIPNLLNGLNNDPLPPPPPMPSVDLSKLSEDDLTLMESIERKGLEARVKHLREIRVLLDAAVFRMDAYMKIAPGDGLSRVDHMVPSSSGASADATHDAETKPSSSNTKETVVSQDAPITVSEPIEEIQPVDENFTEVSAPQNQNERREDENSGSEDEPSANELRRRRLAALDNLDLD